MVSSETRSEDTMDTIAASNTLLRPHWRNPHSPHLDHPPSHLEEGPERDIEGLRGISRAWEGTSFGIEARIWDRLHDPHCICPKATSSSSDVMITCCGTITNSDRRTSQENSPKKSPPQYRASSCGGMTGGGETTNSGRSTKHNLNTSTRVLFDGGSALNFFVTEGNLWSKKRRLGNHDQDTERYEIVVRIFMPTEHKHNILHQSACLHVHVCMYNKKRRLYGKYV